MFRLTFLYLGIFKLLISVFLFFTILFCYYFEFLLNINVYISCLILFLSLSFIFIHFNKKFFNEKINFYEKILLVITGFFYLPLLISIPYYLSIYEISFLNSYFEAVSGFTSTGFSILENTKEIDEPLLIWRSSSQWLGGLYFLYSLFLLTGTSKIKIKNIYSNYESVNLIEIKDQYKKVFIIYSILTALIFILLSFSGIRLFEGLNLSMSIISAGGFIPTNFLNEIIRNENQKFIISICMLFPLFNLYLLYNIFLGDKSLKNNIEDFYLLILLTLMLMFIYVFFNNTIEFSSILFSVLSSLSNIGLGIDMEDSNLSTLFLILVIIGGSSFSTTSGLKFIKLYSLSKFSLKEIYFIVKPLHVSSNTLFLSKHKIKDEEINYYFLSIVFFICCLFILSGILSFENTTFKNLLTISILTLTNTVNSINYTNNEFSFLNLNIISKSSIILFMVIGRVELLSVLILIKKLFTK